MALVPHIFDEASHLMDHNCNNELEYLLRRHPLQAWVRKISSNVTVDKNKYQVCLDVKHFDPEEIIVKTAGDQIVVEGNHEEKQDEHGFISRHFRRRYKLPQDYRAEDVTSSLSSDGVLHIVVPRHQPEELHGERVVPVAITGPVHKSIKHYFPKLHPTH